MLNFYKSINKNSPNHISASKYKLLLILVFFFLIRLFFAYKVAYKGNWWEQLGDQISYKGYALAILNQADWLSNPNFTGSVRAPGYSMFLAIIYSIFGQENFLAVYCIQAFMNTLTIYYIFKTSKDIFGKNISYLCLIWAGFYSFYFYYLGYLLRETLLCFLMIYSFYHLWRFFHKNEHSYFLKSLDLWIFIIAFILLLHTDPRYLFYIPFISILFIIYNNFWDGIKQYSILLIILILLLVPWTIRNYIAYDGFVLIEQQTLDMRPNHSFIKAMVFGDEKSAGLTVMGKGAEATGCILNKDCPSEEERTLIKQGHNYKNRTDNEIDAILNNRYPTKNGLEKIWYHFKMLWRPWHFVNEYMPWPICTFDSKYSLFNFKDVTNTNRPNITAYFGFIKLLTYAVLLPFMILAIIDVLIHRREAYILILPIIVQTMLQSLVYTEGRYRLPIDSFVIILACYGIFVIFGYFSRKHQN